MLRAEAFFETFFFTETAFAFTLLRSDFLADLALRAAFFAVLAPFLAARFAAFTAFFAAFFTVFLTFLAIGFSFYMNMHRWL